MSSKYRLLFLVLILIINVNSFSQSIIRGPYLQKGTTTSIVVKWRTDSNTSSILEYGANTSYNLTISDTNPKTEHELEITGLSPNTKYYYRLGTSGSLLSGSTDLYFRTHPNVGASGAYTFWVLGDCGTADGNAMNVRDAYYSYSGSSETDGILFLGDNAYLDGTDAQYQAAVFNMYDSILKNSISWSCFGNHEGWWKSTSGYPEDFSLSPYYDIYTFPTSGESGGMASGTEAYYSFDYGNIHFMVLDSFGSDRSVGSSMYNWAESDIQNTTQQWIVAFWHHPPYSKGSHDSDNGGNNTSGSDVELIQMRENFLPMLEANGVDLVLAGHSHSYERSYLINGHYGLSGTFNPSNHIINNGNGDGKIYGDGAYNKSISGVDAGLGAVYVVTGSSGKVANLDSDSPHDAMYYTIKALGSSVIEVEGNNLTLKFLRETGTIEDEFTITKDDYDYVYVNNGGWSPSSPGVNSPDDIVIKSGSFDIDDHTSWNSLTVYPQAELNINSGKSLSAGQVTSNGEITLKSGSATYSSLIPNSVDGTGKFNYNRYTNQVGSGTSGGNDLIASPLTGDVMEMFGAFASANPNLSASGDLRAFAPFNNATGSYMNYNVVAHASTFLEAGKGYRAATDDGSPLQFAGTVNTGTVNTTISIGAASKWNLVGNPYSSYLDSQTFLTVNGGVIDETVLDPNYNAIYGYNDGTDGGNIWTIINSVQNVGKNIAPGQGFYVASNGTGGSNNLTFTPAMRTLTGTDDFILGRNSQDYSISHLELKIENSATSYKTDFYYSDSCTSGLDPGYDAGSFDASESDLSIYSHLVSDNSGIDMAIQALSNTDINNITVPLGINANQGEQITIGISENDLPETTNVYLEDNLKNTYTLLNDNDYVLTPIQDLKGTGRFFLHFSASTLSTDDKGINGLQIFTTDNPKRLIVNGKLSDFSNLKIYDVQGRLVMSRNLNVNSNSNAIDIETISTGVYIVKLKNGDLIKTQKVIIK